MSGTNAMTMSEKDRHATFKDVREDVRELKSDLTDAVSETAQQGMEAARHGAETAIEKTVETGRKAADSALATHERLCEHVSNHPTSSILIAFGVGALASRLMSKR